MFHLLYPKVNKINSKNLSKMFKNTVDNGEIYSANIGYKGSTGKTDVIKI